MAKAKIGIHERTATEQAVLTPQEQFQALSDRIPMQAPTSFHWVRLRHVPAKLELGWLFKRQNRLQETKVNLAVAIHNAYRADRFTTAQVAKMMEQVARATLRTISAAKKDVLARLGGETALGMTG